MPPVIGVHRFQPPPPPRPPRLDPLPAVREKQGDRTGGAWLAEFDGSGKIYFDFNPEKITVQHTAATEKIPSQQRSTIEESIRAQGITTVNVNDIIFDGKGVQDTCDQLIAWSFPVPNDSGKEKPDLTHLPLLKFMWGGLVIIATLNTVTVVYTRFSRHGIPMRAKVSLTLHQTNVPRTKTNPTSGGLPGRRTHVVTSGECLPAIATANYGVPGDWRLLAQANHVDDPLRVRPGTALYLPGPGELAPLPAEGS